MGWKRKAEKGGDFEKPPAGNHPAALVALVDMGVQENEFQGEKTYQHRAYFCFELVSEKKQNGSNHLIGIDLTVSLNERSKLRAWIKAWRGKDIADGEEFDISVLVGKKCLLSVIEKGGYAKIEGLSQLPKGMTTPEPEHKAFLWSLDDLKEGQAIELPSWLPYLYGEPLKDWIDRRCEPDTEPAGSVASNGPTQAELDEMF